MRDTRLERGRPCFNPACVSTEGPGSKGVLTFYEPFWRGPRARLVICVGVVHRTAQFFENFLDADRYGEPWLLELGGEDDMRRIGASLGQSLPWRPRSRATPLVCKLVVGTVCHLLDIVSLSWDDSG